MIAWLLANMAWASVVMLFVLAVRKPVAARFGAGAAYALWLLPAARLIMPPLPSLPAFVPELPALLPSTAQLPSMFFELPQGTANAPQPSIGEPGLWVQWTPWLLALWAVGAAIFILWQIVRHRAFLNRLSVSARCRGTHSGLQLVESEAVDGPLALGLVNRRIVVPRDFDRRYTKAERQLALAHETVHHRRGDIWWNHAALALLTLSWFNPIAWLAFRAFREDQELACDAMVAAGATLKAREHYARALVKSASRPGLITACPLHHADQLKRRLRMMKAHRNSRARTICGAGTIAALGALMVALAAPGVARPIEQIKGPAVRVRNMVVNFAPQPVRPETSRLATLPDGRAGVSPSALQLPRLENEQPQRQAQPAAAQTPAPPWSAGTAAHMAGNHPEAVRLLSIAADKGDPTSIFFLGSYYDSGNGVQQDKAKALALYRQAANAGSPPAMLKLVLAYESGDLGLNADKTQAAAWLGRFVHATGPDPDPDIAKMIKDKYAQLNARP